MLPVPGFAGTWTYDLLSFPPTLIMADGSGFLRDGYFGSSD